MLALLKDYLDQPLTPYAITDADMAGPFLQQVPADMMAQAQLPHLGYVSVGEMLGERFHASPTLLQRLNPGVTPAAGVEILVPNVEPYVPAGKGVKRVRVTARTPVTVTVSGTARTVTVQDEAGMVLFFAPVTVGGEHDPLPVGKSVQALVGDGDMQEVERAHGPLA